MWTSLHHVALGSSGESSLSALTVSGAGLTPAVRTEPSVQTSIPFAPAWSYLVTHSHMTKQSESTERTYTQAGNDQQWDRRLSVFCIFQITVKLFSTSSCLQKKLQMPVSRSKPKLDWAGRRTVGWARALVLEQRPGSSSALVSVFRKSRASPGLWLLSRPSSSLGSAPAAILGSLWVLPGPNLPVPPPPQ